MITAIVILSMLLGLVGWIAVVNMRDKFRYHLRCKTLLDALRQSTFTKDVHDRMVKNAHAIDEMPFAQLWDMYNDDDWKTPLGVLGDGRGE